MARGQGKKTQILTQTRLAAKAPAKAPMKEQANNVILSLDIGTRSIIGMVGIVEESKVKVVAIEREEHAERAMLDGQIENIEKVSLLAVKVKKRLEEKTRIKLSRVCVAAAGRALKTKRADFEMSLPGTQLIDDEIISRLEAGAITRAEEIFDKENEAQHDSRRFYLVGYTVCQYFLDQYPISSLKDHRGRHLQVDLIATFLPSEVVESLYTTMHKIGLEVASLTLEPIAAINAAIPANIRLLNLVMVDIGAGTSDIAACTGGSVTGYTMATVAGDEITETIMKQYLVDFPTAEKMKMQLDQPEEEISFMDILGIEQQLSKEELFKNIQGTIEALSKEIADKVVEINGSHPSALFLVGGGSKLNGLREGITAALGMDEKRVTIAGTYFQANAFSDEYELNNPEYATPLGILVSSGLNMINDSFRVMLNGRPAKLFRSGSFTALNLLMMNGYNFRDIMGRAGANITVTVNGMRKVFYGLASDPASLMINQKEGKLSDIIHAGDFIEFIPARQGAPSKACVRDVEGASVSGAQVTVNGIAVPLDMLLKNGDAVEVKIPRKPTIQQSEERMSEETPAEETSTEEPSFEETPAEEGLTEETPAEENPLTEMEKPENNEMSGSIEDMDGSSERTAKTLEKAAAVSEELTEHTEEAKQGHFAASEYRADVSENEAVSKDRTDTADSTSDMPDKISGRGSNPGVKMDEAVTEEPPTEMISYRLNGETLSLPKKKDGRPYYLMDLIQYSGIDLDHPRGTVSLKVNGEEGRFQQVLREGDRIFIEEEIR